MKYGLHVVEGPDRRGHSKRRHDDGSSEAGARKGVVMKTVLITGCSSGYGLETARHFHENGWNVIATMRTPREEILPRSDRLRVLPLDVSKSESIAAAIEAGGA